MKIECTPEEFAVLVFEIRKWVNATVNPIDLSEIIIQNAQTSVLI